MSAKRSLLTQRNLWGSLLRHMATRVSYPACSLGGCVICDHLFSKVLERKSIDEPGVKYLPLTQYQGTTMFSLTFPGWFEDKRPWPSSPVLCSKWRGWAHIPRGGCSREERECHWILGVASTDVVSEVAGGMMQLNSYK